MQEIEPRKTILDLHFKSSIEPMVLREEAARLLMQVLEIEHYSAGARNFDLRDFENRERVGIEVQRVFFELDGEGSRQVEIKIERHWELIVKLAG